ncbi:ribosome hibernation-promoting factor, HPF/YfiA family [Ferrimonas marina]|uniref:Ribosome-associated inhibitor A n=1 Tax=Ferrimonas marina TaxID=299255 RepID=A0A1M5ZTH3_9GAMM|nr:ribosome-associated translation inhibitor RaiA [Ferrimonas marina]SHI27540.1 ribosome-associated inhibitor A [Ferrimonas marina]
MRIEITSKSVAITTPMQNRVQACIDKLLRHNIDVIKPHVIITTEGKVFQVEANVNTNVGQLFASGQHEDLYVAINQMGNKLERQLNKLTHKETARRHDRTMAVAGQQPDEEAA